MSNIPAIKGNADAAQAFLSQNKVNPTTAGGNFLRYDSKRTGEWLFGADGEPVTGDEFALDVQSIQHGYILWHAKKADRKMVPINQVLPEPQDPIHYEDKDGKPQTDEPAEARHIKGRFVEDGVEFDFETSTFGGRKAIDNDILAPLFTRAAAGSKFLFPVVRLESESYEHSQWGKVYSPVFLVTAWYDADGNPETDAAQALEAQGEAPAAEPEPQRRRRRPAA